MYMYVWPSTEKGGPRSDALESQLFDTAREGQIIPGIFTPWRGGVFKARDLQSEEDGREQKQKVAL